MSRRVLLLLTDLKIGGTPTVVREIASRLHDPPRVAMHVACLDHRGPVADQLDDRGIPITALDAAGPYDVTVVKRLIGLIRVQQFDTVLSFLVHANATAALAAHFCPGVRFLQSIQTTQPHPRWHWRVQKWAQHASDTIVVPSPSVAAIARRWAGVAEQKIVVIPNGIDLPSALPPAAAAAAPHRVVFIGRLDPIKRLPDLLQAMSLLHGKARLDIYGEGAERGRLTHQIQKLGLASLVTLHGSIPNAASALRDAELLVLPSEAEGFGLVLIEAMAAGVAVVGTDAPGIRDVVINSQTGVLVPVARPSALAEAMRNVLANQALRKTLIANAWIDVRKRFTWDSAIGDYRRLLRL